MQETVQKIFVYLVLGPHFIMWVADPILEKIFSGFNTSDYRGLGYALIILSMLGGLLVIYKKWQSKTPGVGWYAIGGVTFLGNAFWLYFVYSISNFGF